MTRVVWICILLLSATLFTAGAVAEETCVNYAKAALEEQFPKAFASEATVQGPMSIEVIEREELVRIAECSDCPQKPFGYLHSEWEEFKSLIRADDCVVFFRSNPASWKGLYGTEGYALIRNGRIVRTLLTRMS